MTSLLQVIGNSFTNDNLETKTRFDLIESQLSERNEIKIALCQLFRDKHLVFSEWGQTKDDKGHSIDVSQGDHDKYKEKLKRMIDQANKDGADLIILPEYSLPFGFTPENLSDTAIIAGQLKNASSEITTDEASKKEARLDLLKIVSRRINMLIEHKKIEKQEEADRAFASYIEKVQSLIAPVDDEDFFQNSLRFIEKGMPSRYSYKNVLPIAELLAKKQIMRGAGYTAINMSFGYMLMTAGTDMLGKTPYYFGEQELIRKFLNLLNNQEYDPFYRLNMQSLLKCYSKGKQIPALTVIARESFPEYHHDRIISLYRKKTGLQLAFYANGLVDSGGTSLFFPTEDLQSESLPESDIERVAYRISLPPDEETSVTRITIPKFIEGLFTVNLQGSPGDISLTNLRFSILN